MAEELCKDVGFNDSHICFADFLHLVDCIENPLMLEGWKPTHDVYGLIEVSNEIAEFIAANPIDSLVDHEDEAEEPAKILHFVIECDVGNEEGRVYFLEFDERLRENFGRLKTDNIFEDVQNRKYKYFIRVIAHSKRWKRLRVFTNLGSGLTDSFSSDIRQNRSKGDKQLRGDHHFYTRSSNFSLFKIFKDQILIADNAGKDPSKM